jgi:hypothetical protein
MQALYYLEGLSEDGGWADFSQKLPSLSLFNDDLSNEPNFGRIHLAVQYLLNSRLLIGVLCLIFRSAYSPGPEREAASKYWLELLSVSQPGMRGWVWGPDYPWDFLLTVLETAAAAPATRRPTRYHVCFLLYRTWKNFIRGLLF